MTAAVGNGAESSTGRRLRAPFALFFTSFVVSALGDAFRLLAVNVWLFEATSGSTGMRLLVVLLANVPGMLLGGLSGVVADRYDTYTVLVVSDLVRAGVGLGLAWCAHDGRTVPALVLVAVGNGVGVFFSSSSFSLLPRLLTGQRLPRANGLMETGQWVVGIVGPALAALTLAAGGASRAFVIDSVSFVASALILGYLRRSLRTPGPRPAGDGASAVAAGADDGAGPGGAGRPSHWADFVDGVAVVRRSPEIRSLLLASYGTAFMTACTNYGLIFLVVRTFALGTASLGYLYSLNGAVAVVAAALVTALARPALLGRLMAFSMLGLCAAQVVIGAAPTVYVLSVGVVISALSNAPYNVAVTSLYMSRIPPDFLGRVEGVDTMADNAVNILGFVAASLIVSGWDPRAVFLVSAVAAVPSLVLAFRHAAPGGAAVGGPSKGTGSAG
ncbi:MFS transporter [Streptomyces fuscigenes]|uniref:MFS transporter n=1 Tax=Streptomyces fuscigenes TaxID=1528880 RepID=UPI001F47385D|nr:MFS transporter [Streptomyces fuscigenes]MCF3964507.1 MFS transporter [Streptomyces fuscigenes]